MTELGGSFDIAASAGWYSAVAGLLAGFALLAILLPLDHEAEDGEAVYGANTVVIYVCSFFSLLILSVSYAVLAGRTGGGAVAGVAAHEQMLFGAAFGLATLPLLFGLHAILRTYGGLAEPAAVRRRGRPGRCGCQHRLVDRPLTTPTRSASGRLLIKRLALSDAACWDRRYWR